MEIHAATYIYYLETRLYSERFSQHYISPLFKGNSFKASALLIISYEVHAYAIAAQTNCKLYQITL